MRIYVSYVESNRELSIKIINALKKLEHDIWHKDDIEPARNIQDEVNREIQNCGLFMIILSEDYHRNPPRDYEPAVQKRKNILPVEIESIRESRRRQAHLNGIQPFDFKNYGQDYEATINSLSNKLKEITKATKLAYINSLLLSLLITIIVLVSLYNSEIYAIASLLLGFVPFITFLADRNFKRFSERVFNTVSGTIILSVCIVSFLVYTLIIANNSSTPPSSSTSINTFTATPTESATSTATPTESPTSSPTSLLTDTPTHTLTFTTTPTPQNILMEVLAVVDNRIEIIRTGSSDLSFYQDKIGEELVVYQDALGQLPIAIVRITQYTAAGSQDKDILRAEVLLYDPENPIEAGLPIDDQVEYVDQFQLVPTTENIVGSINIQRADLVVLNLNGSEIGNCDVLEAVERRDDSASSNLKGYYPLDPPLKMIVREDPDTAAAIVEILEGTWVSQNTWVRHQPTAVVDLNKYPNCLPVTDTPTPPSIAMEVLSVDGTRIEIIRTGSGDLSFYQDKIGDELVVYQDTIVRTPIAIVRITQYTAAGSEEKDVLRAEVLLYDPENPIVPGLPVDDDVEPVNEFDLVPTTRNIVGVINNIRSEVAILKVNGSEIDNCDVLEAVERRDDSESSNLKGYYSLDPPLRMLVRSKNPDTNIATVEILEGTWVSEYTWVRHQTSATIDFDKYPDCSPTTATPTATATPSLTPTLDQTQTMQALEATLTSNGLIMIPNSESKSYILPASVTNGEFLEFTRAGGYEDEGQSNYWSDNGRQWLNHMGYSAPPTPEQNAVNSARMGLFYYEWEAYCNWLGTQAPYLDQYRVRLPTQDELEAVSTSISLYDNDAPARIWIAGESPFRIFVVADGSLMVIPREYHTLADVGAYCVFDIPES